MRVFGSGNRALFFATNFGQRQKSNVKCSSDSSEVSYSRPSANEYVTLSNHLLSDARIIYCAAPALGHNKVCGIFIHLLNLFTDITGHLCILRKQAFNYNIKCHVL